MVKNIDQCLPEPQITTLNYQIAQRSSLECLFFRELMIKIAGD